jgi:sugar lactone lactonase YvrE
LKVTPSGSVSVFATGLGEPVGLIRANDGSFFYASNAGGSAIEKISLAGTVTPFISIPANSFPQWLALDGSGNLFVSNASGNNIDKITPSGSVSTFASGFAEPEGLAFDRSGNLFVAEYLGRKIDKVTPDGTVTTFVSGLPGNANDIAFDQRGNLFVSLNVQGAILEITPSGAVSTFATGATGADGILVAVPEPASVSLLGAAGLGLGAVWWRRGKKGARG